jgi:predicted nucleic acid-binding protein
MAGLSAYFFDTSVILAGIIELGSDHAASQVVMDAIADGRFEGPMTAWHCCLEFYSVATRLPRELRISPDAALTLVEQEILARFHVHALPRNRRESFLRGVAHDAITGGRIYDAHIAEIARHAGAAVVVTENRRHFTQLLRHGVRVLTSEELTEMI